MIVITWYTNNHSVNLRNCYKHALILISFYFQVLRDLGFMIPDLLHVCLPLYELRRSRKERCRLHFTEFLGLVILVSLGFLVCSLL